MKYVWCIKWSFIFDSLTSVLLFTRLHAQMRFVSILLSGIIEHYFPINIRFRYMYHLCNRQRTVHRFVYLWWKCNYWFEIPLYWSRSCFFCCTSNIDQLITVQVIQCTFLWKKHWLNFGTRASLYFYQLYYTRRELISWRTLVLSER